MEKISDLLIVYFRSFYDEKGNSRMQGVRRYPPLYLQPYLYRLDEPGRRSLPILFVRVQFSMLMR